MKKQTKAKPKAKPQAKKPSAKAAKKRATAEIAHIGIDCARGEAPALDAALGWWHMKREAHIFRSPWHHETPASVQTIRDGVLLMANEQERRQKDEAQSARTARIRDAQKRIEAFAGEEIAAAVAGLPSPTEERERVRAEREQKWRKEAYDDGERFGLALARQEFRRLNAIQRLLFC